MRLIEIMCCETYLQDLPIFYTQSCLGKKQQNNYVISALTACDQVIQDFKHSPAPKV